MNGYVWICKTCNAELPDAPGLKDHRDQTGHLGAVVQFESPDAMSMEAARLHSAEIAKRIRHTFGSAS